MNQPPPPSSELTRDEAIREAVVRAALEAFEDASMSGLCCTGAWECAVGAMRTLDLEAALRQKP